MNKPSPCQNHPSPSPTTVPEKSNSKHLTATAFIAFGFLTISTCLLYSINGYAKVYQPVLVAVLFAVIFAIIPVDMLIRYSWVWYVSFVFVSVIGLLSGQIKGEFILIGNIFSINLPSWASMLFIPITFLIIRYKNYSWRYLSMIYLAAGVPSMFLLLCRFETSLATVLVYWITLILMMVKASLEKRLKIKLFVLMFTLELSFAIPSVIFILTHPHVLARVLNYMENPAPSAVQVVFEEKIALAGEILKSAPLFTGFICG